MASIRQLLLTVPGETRESTKRTTDALSKAGFDLDATDGLGAFRSLDVKELSALVEPPLDLREQGALKAAIQSNVTFGTGISLLAVGTLEWDQLLIKAGLPKAAVYA